MNRFFLIFTGICLMVGCTAKLPAELVDWQLNGFIKVDSLNPILTPADQMTFYCPIEQRQITWESRNVLNPSAVVKNDSVILLYRAQDAPGTSRIGLAYSTDGLHFEKRSAPVFYPGEDQMKKYEWNYLKMTGQPYDDNCASCLFDGVEDPRIVSHPDGGYIMTYTAYDGKTARLAIATSSDLLSWNKHGLVLSDSVFHSHWSKSGAIISRQIGDQVVAHQIGGKFWMYFGDKQLHMASSEDLIHWQPLIDDESGQLISVLHPRPGYFDSRLVEPGPYALWTPSGIILIYNASNAQNQNDPGLPKFTYAAGQALFDPLVPYRLIERSSDYFLYPDKSYEKVGEVNEVCFVEGLVPFRNQWFLYYGTADTRIAVAVASQ